MKKVQAVVGSRHPGISGKQFLCAYGTLWKQTTRELRGLSFLLMATFLFGLCVSEVGSVMSFKEWHTTISGGQLLICQTESTVLQSIKQE